MDRIYKYIVGPQDYSFGITGFVKVISAEEQEGNVVVYILIEDDRTDRWRLDFQKIGTGQPANDVRGWTFLNTVKQGVFMWHVFYRVRQGG